MKKLVVGAMLLIGCGGATMKDGGHTIFYGHETHWNKEDFPIKVLIDAKINEESKNKFEEAITEWNDEVGGTPVFIHEYVDVDAIVKRSCKTITIQVQEIHEGENPKINSWDGYHSFTAFNDARFCSGKIIIDDDTPVNWYQPLTVHELGHGLGLAHDEDNRFSIMYPIIRGNWAPQSITKDDKEKIVAMKNGTWKETVKPSSAPTVRRNDHGYVILER